MNQRRTKDNCNIKNDEQVICGSKTEKTSLLSSFSNVNDSLKNNDESSFNSTFNFEEVRGKIKTMEITHDSCEIPQAPGGFLTFHQGGGGRKSRAGG